MQNNPLISSLQKVMSEAFIRYNGCIIEKFGSKFRRNGKTFDTLEDAKKSIDNGLKALQNSIR